MEPFNFRTVDRETKAVTFQWGSELPNRPGFNTTGKAIQVRVNQFKVSSFPNRDVYQYDVSSLLPPAGIIVLMSHRFQSVTMLKRRVKSWLFGNPVSFKPS
jgi:hypothetical protein